MMILWANIFVDVPPSFALGMEPTEADIMTVCRAQWWRL